MTNGLKTKQEQISPQKPKVEEKVEKIEKKIEKPVKHYFHILKIDEERQKKVIEQIKENAEPDFDYILLLVFSTIIVSLGLIIDSAAVVIGGMIIAPLIWPVLALAIAVIKGNARGIKKALFTIIKSSLIIFAVSFLIGMISPSWIESSEIITRVKPTLFELFIALAAGFIGAFVVAHPKLSAALAGVVAAAALVPPLAIVGVTLAERSLAEAGGASLLYLSNLIAITFAAIILFLLVGVKFPRTEVSKTKAVGNIFWFIIFLVIIIIPLTLIMKDAIVENQEKAILEEVIEKNIASSRVTRLSIDRGENKINISVTIQSPQLLSAWHIDRLTDVLVGRLNQTVSLKVNTIYIHEASSK